MIVTRKEAEKKLGKELRGPQYVGKRWFLLSRSVPHRNLGGFATKQEAKDHERAVQYFKRNPRETPVPPGVRDRRLWLRQRAQVKKRVDVWPSAYASGQVVQEYKRAGGRFYNPSSPLDNEALLELELAVIENPKPRKSDWDIKDERGTVGLTFNWFEWAPGYALIRDLEASKKRKGYGSSLVEDAIAKARKRKAEGIILPPPESTEAEKFWKSQAGWKPLRKKGYRGWMVYELAKENPLTGLDKWFAEEWVDMARSVYLSGPKAGQLKPGGWVKCGRPDTTKGGYPKCRPLAEAKKMTPEQRIYAIRKKRSAEKIAPKKKGRAPIMVKTYKKKPKDNPRSKYDAHASKIAKKLFLLFKKNDIFKARSSTIDGFEEFSNPAEHYADDAGTVKVLGNTFSLHIGLRIDRRLNRLSLSGGFEPETGRLTVFAARPYRLRENVDMNAAYMRIYEIVRHEMEHALQGEGEGAGDMPGKDIRSARDFNDYYMDPIEIEAYAVGLYALAKKRGIPFSIILKDFKRKLELNYPRVHKRHVGRFVKAVESYAAKRYPRLSGSPSVTKRGAKGLRKMVSKSNPSSLRKDLEKMLKQAEKLGCVVNRDSKHYKVRCPEGPQIIVPKTPSGSRTLQNVRRDFRRAGVHLNPEAAPEANPERKKLYIYPNKSAVKIAKQALERRKDLPKSKRGGLDAMEAHEQGIGSGVLRARDIAAGKRINAYQVKAFFDRHRSNFVKAKADGKKWEDSKAWQAWDLWGGEPLRKQVEKAVAKDKKEREKNPPKKMPSYNVIRFLSYPSQSLYEKVGVTDSIGRHTPLPDDMLSDFERADKMLQQASRMDPMYVGRDDLIKEADAILRPMADRLWEIHVDRVRKHKPARKRHRMNPYRKERFEHEGVPAERVTKTWGEWEAEQGMYTGPIPPDPVAERKRRAEIKAKAQAKLKKLKGNPDKPPLAKDLIAECRALWESYCERPGKVKLLKVEKHCDAMKASKFKTVKDERRRCMNAVRREKKKLGM